MGLPDGEDDNFGIGFIHVGSTMENDQIDANDYDFGFQDNAQSSGISFVETNAS